MQRPHTFHDRITLFLFSIAIITSLYSLPQIKAEDRTFDTTTLPSFVPPVTPAQANPHYASATTKILSSISTEASTMAVTGTLAFIGSPTSLSLIDERDPSRLGKRTLLSLGVRKIQLVGDRAYVGTNSDGLYILNSSNPISPTVLGKFGSPATIRDIQVVGTTVYAIASIHDSQQNKDLTNLQIIDISQPSAPHLLSSLPLQATSASLRVSLSRIYVDSLYIPLTGSGPGFGIIDVSDPANPIPLAVYTDIFTSFEVIGTTVYRVANNALETIDTSTPTTPVTLSSIPVDFSPNALHLVDNRIYVSGLNSDRLSDAVTRFAVDSPTSTTKLNSFNLPIAQCVYDLDVVGTTLSVLGCNSLYIFTLVPNAEPVVLGKYAAPKDVRRVEVIGNYAYLLEAIQVDYPAYCYGGGNRLWIFDISDSKLPIFISSIDLSTIGARFPTCDHLSQIISNRVYISGIKIYNIDDKKLPFLEATITMPIPGTVFQMENDIAYLVDKSAYNSTGPKVSLVDTSVLTTPVLLGSYTFLDTSIIAMQSIDEILYVATSHGLSILDVEDPTQPILLNLTPFTLDFGISSLKVVDQHVFINGLAISSNSMLAIVDVSNLAMPVLLSKINTGSWSSYQSQFAGPTSIEIANGLLFLNNGTDTYSWDILDVTDATNPVVVGHYTSSGTLHGSDGTPQDAQLIGNLLYLGSKEGFQILEVTAPMCNCSKIYLPTVSQPLPST